MKPETKQKPVVKSGYRFSDIVPFALFAEQLSAIIAPARILQSANIALFFLQSGV
jgi:hypothetical protein